MRAFVAQIDPQPTNFGLAVARRQDVDRRVVSVDHVARHHVLRDQLDQRMQKPRDRPEPFGELAAIDIEPQARVDLGLPVERQVVARLRNQDVGEEARIDHAARDRQLGHWCLHHRLALPARARRAHVAIHFEVAGHVAENLGNALAHIAQIGATTAFADIGRAVRDIATPKLRRQLPALLSFGRIRLLWRGAGWMRRLGIGLRLLRLRRNRLGFCRLCFLQRQFQLFERAVDALGIRAELLAAKLGDLRLQLLDRQLWRPQQQKRVAACSPVAGDPWRDRHLLYLDVG